MKVCVVIMCAVVSTSWARAEPPVHQHLPRANSYDTATKSSYVPRSAKPTDTYGAPTNAYAYTASTYGAPASGHPGDTFSYGTPASMHSYRFSTRGTPPITHSYTYGTPASTHSSHASSRVAPAGAHSSQYSTYGTPASMHSTLPSNYGSPATNFRHFPSSSRGFGKPMHRTGAVSYMRGAKAPTRMGTIFSTAPSSMYGASAIRYAAPSSMYGVPGYAKHRPAERDMAEPANYQFSYDVQDAQSGSDFGHLESRQGDAAWGSYKVLLPDGRKQIVEYEADQGGYRPMIRYEESQAGYGYGRGAGGPY